jgi:CubicO group peptidase (beta-lactamase class C family)
MTTTRRACLALLLLAPPWPALADPAWPGSTWQQVAPDTVGWSRAGLAAADDVAHTIRTDAYLVVHRGQIVHAFGDTAKRGNLYSVRKSVLSILFGMHADRGTLDIRKSLAQIGIDDRQALSEREKTATVRQLLQSRSGVYHPAAYETAGMAAQRPLRGSHSPGDHWYYNNWDFNTLGTVFERFTGRTVFESLDADLAQPLGFEDLRLAEDTTFVRERVSEHAAYTMRLSARDLARVGLLMARGGRWRDRQLLSPEWIAQSTAPHSAVSSAVGYGYMWWVALDGWPFWRKAPGEVFYAWGNHGQFLVVSPRDDVVIVHRTDGGRVFGASVTPAQFARLLERIVAASPGLHAPRP